MRRFRFGNGGSLSEVSPPSLFLGSRTEPVDARRAQPVPHQASTRRYGVGDIFKLTALSLLVLLIIWVCLLTGLWLSILIMALFLMTCLTHLLSGPHGGTTSGMQPTRTSGSVTLQDGDLRLTSVPLEGLSLDQVLAMYQAGLTSMSAVISYLSQDSSLTASKSASSAASEGRSSRSLKAPAK